jgi:hypothetical protein
MEENFTQICWAFNSHWCRSFTLGIAIGYNDEVSNHKINAAFAQGPQGGNYTFGVLASIQNQNGDPFWIVSGNWRTNLLDIANQSQMTARGNMLQQGTLASVFNTSVRMINFNGTGEHTHTHSITNFALENFITPNNMTTIFNGMSLGILGRDLSQIFQQQ